jgi:hypothetical protein
MSPTGLEHVSQTQAGDDLSRIHHGTGDQAGHIMTAHACPASHRAARHIRKSPFGLDEMVSTNLVEPSRRPIKK